MKDDCIYCTQPASATTVSNISTIVLPADFSGNHPIAIGDILTWDVSLNGGNGGVRSMDGTTDSYLAGIARESLALHSLNKSIKVQFKGIVNLPTATGAVYTPLQTVAINPAHLSQVVDTSLGDANVGIVFLPSGPTSVTGGPGVTVPVLLTSNLPVIANIASYIS